MTDAQNPIGGQDRADRDAVDLERAEAEHVRSDRGRVDPERSAAGFRPAVWAPIPDAVAVEIDGERHPLRRDEGDWWVWDGDPLAPGTRYGFVLSGGDAPDQALPDPRGRRLPDGVHGTSAVVEPAPAPVVGWTGRELVDGVIYELHVGTFTPGGTLDSAIERLDHLVELGIDFVEVLPVNAFNGEWNWGYDGVAWFAVQESYGGPDAYRRFVQAAHDRGLAVVQDVVYNHLGPSGNYLPLFGEYLRTGSSNTWGDTVNVDEPEVRSYILDDVRMWFEEYGVDGLRLDAVHAIVDENSPKHILREIAELTERLSRELGRPLTLIAESDLNDPDMISPEGKDMTAQWSDDYHHSVHVALTGETTGYYEDFAPLGSLAKAWGQGFFHDGTYSTFREADHGKPIPSGFPASWLVTFSQDHDQIGNRAAGDRLTATLSPERLAVAAVLTVASPYTPMLFMGEEWGASTPWQFFTSHPEPELGKVTAEGRIAEFAKMGWDPDVVPDPQDPETFRRSHLDWSELDEPAHRRLYDVYRELIALRRTLPELGEATMAELSGEVDDEARTLALRSRDVVVYVNLGDADYTVPADELLFRTSDDVFSPADGDLTLPPDTAVIARLARR